MKNNLLLAICFVLFIFSACKKTCRVCECEKNGQKTIEKSCAYGKSGAKSLNNWEKYVKEEKGYDSVECKDE
jgi:hypothetical protein